MIFDKWLKTITEQYNVSEEFCLDVLQGALYDIDKAIADFESDSLDFHIFYLQVRGIAVTMCFKKIIFLLDSDGFSLNDFKKELDLYRTTHLV